MLRSRRGFAHGPDCGLHADRRSGSGFAIRARRGSSVGGERRSVERRDRSVIPVCGRGTTDPDPVELGADPRQQPGGWPSPCSAQTLWMNATGLPAALAAAVACVHLRMATWRSRWTASRPRRASTEILRDGDVRPSHAGPPRRIRPRTPENLGRPHAAVPSPRRRPHTPQTAGRETTMTATTGATFSSSDRAIEAATTATVPASQRARHPDRHLAAAGVGDADRDRTPLGGRRTASLAGSRPYRAPP